MQRIQLSKNFFLDEFERSQTAARLGIDNKIEVGSTIYHSIYELVRNVLQPVRDSLGLVTVTSGYRGHDLNEAISGSSNSQHTKGEATDFVVSGMSPYDVCVWINTYLSYEFDQIILEFGSWTHVSRSYEKGQRRELLTAVKEDTGTQYVKGLFP